jgi:hypothetical protein
LVLLIFGQLERPAADHGVVGKIGGALAGVLLPNMLGQHKEVEQLALQVGDRLGQREHDGAGVGCFDAGKVAGVGVEKGKILMRLIEVVREGDVLRRQRLPVVKGEAVANLESPDQAVVGDGEALGQFRRVAAIQLQLEHGIVDQPVDRVRLGQHANAGVERVRATAPTDARRGAGRRCGGALTAGCVAGGRGCAAAGRHHQHRQQRQKDVPSRKHGRYLL